MVALAAVILLGVGSFASFMAQNWFGGLFPMPDFSKLEKWQWFLVIALPLGLIALGGAVAFIAFGQRWEEQRINDMLRQWKKSTDHLIAKLSTGALDVEGQWKRCAADIETQLLKARFGELWLSHPWEYEKYLQDVDAAYAAEHQQHVNEITLYGTMVGFSFLLPVPLFEHVLRAQGQFTHLRLLAQTPGAACPAAGNLMRSCPVSLSTLSVSLGLCYSDPIRPFRTY